MTMKTLMILGAAVCTLAACSESPKYDAQAAPAGAGASISIPNDGSLIPGTPAGDLGDWVRDIRSGIAEVPQLAVADAQKRTLDLYVTRQEYAEMYYGVDGRIKGSPELSDAIEGAEVRFHALMQLFTQSTPTASAVADAVTALDAQQSKVVELWQASGLKLERSVR